VKFEIRAITSAYIRFIVGWKPGSGASRRSSGTFEFQPLVVRRLVEIEKLMRGDPGLAQMPRHSQKTSRPA